MDAEHEKHLIALNRAGLAFEALRYFIVERRMLKLGIHVRRDIGNMAKTFKIPRAKVEEVLCSIFRDLLGEVCPSIQSVECEVSISVERGEISRKILKHLLGKTILKYLQSKMNASEVRERIRMARKIGFPHGMVDEFLESLYVELHVEMLNSRQPLHLK